MTAEADAIKNQYYPVLDHGFVALKDYMGGDSDIVDAARTSYGYGTSKKSTDRGLIRYLMRHWHTTPFEMVELKFHVKLPIFVARQLVRHRTASLNEYSGRYSLMPMLFYTPEIDDFSKQSKGNRQGREDWMNLTESEQHAMYRLYQATTSRWDENRKELADQYEDLVNEGVARELARIDLPLSMYTEWYWKVDLHNLFHFLRLRCDLHAQQEIREFANVKAAMVQLVAPLAFEAWIDYRLCGVSLSYQEIEMIRKLLSAGEEGAEKEIARLLRVTPHELSHREADEFKSKMLPSPRPLFTLPESRPVQHFIDKAEAAVPKVDVSKESP